jgi:diguanylate cyclase (GGDEF)-like protein/PAS domain S-box-containing protein
MIRKSLAVYIIGLIVLMVFLTAASHYYTELLNRQDILLIHEDSKDSDIRYVIQSLISSEAERLVSLARSLKDSEDLIVDMAVSSSHDEEAGGIQKVVDGLVRKLNVDIFQVTDQQGVILYNSYDASRRGTPADYSGIVAGLEEKDVLEVSGSESEWKIRAIVAAMLEQEFVGTIMIGTLIDDDLASDFAKATDVQLTIGTGDSVVASSLPPMERGHLDFKTLRRALAEESHIRENIPHTNRVVNYAPINMAGKVFSLVVEFDNSEFMLLQELRKKRYYIIFSSIILASIFLGAVLTFYLVSPLKKLKSKAGSTVLEITGKEIEQHSGNEVQTLVQSFDIMVESLTNHIEERKRAEDELLKSERKYRSLVDSTEDSIYLVDWDYKYVFMNRKHLMRLGLSEDNYIGQAYGDHHSAEENELFEGKIKRVFETGKSYQYEHKSKRDGKFFLRTLSPVMNNDGSMAAVTVLSKDITYLKTMEDELRELSLTDELTGLYNRRGFLTLADRQMRLAGRLEKQIYLLFADIDGMKEINDTYGHEEGDIVLQNMAELLRESYRETDLIARIGGDEFIVLVFEKSDNNPNSMLGRFQDKLDAFNMRGSKDYRLSVSIGIAQYDPEDPVPIDQLIRRADRTMYKKKSQRKNRTS